MSRGRRSSQGSHHDEKLEYAAWREAHVEPGASKTIDPNAPVGQLEQIPPDKALGRKRRLYFTDPSGVRWRVYDVTFGPPEGPPRHEIAYPPPYPAAKARVFIAANGARRSFSFADRHAPSEARRPVITPAVVSTQFRFAQYGEATIAELLDPRRDFTVLPLPKWTPSDQHERRFWMSTLNRWAAYEAD